ncbi:N-acetylmuramoyl-L-alanine amidase [Streptomyces sp. SA15]|uniref:N-acetylmuramoyl-L-alanine amidase n=1 Tax=Streptomyces sp. SA15 TaxID=934019 RepID=UPI000BAE92DA|nr:N-acetylmuramoyl-L-alanine amidase [Streptomyces sp. SA15]PAZ15690.1 N-acetylmuramoyl-L-alanine amidase [Streptomyces sp. SA15]
MATPLSAAVFLARLRAEGVKVQEHGDWPHHNRNSKGAWGPVHGVMIHHTVTKGSARTVDICRKGYADLPGPLCHGVITKDGTVHLIGYGRANHAGLGDDDVLRAVIGDKVVPGDNEANTDGNRHFYGFECENLGDGEDPWPAAQMEAIEKAAAAICRHHGWTERSVIGHLEWQPGKVDPRGFTMASMRARIQERLDTKTSDTPAKPAAPKPLPKPQKPTVDLSKLVAAARSNPKASGTPVTYSGVRIVETALVNAGLLAKVYSDGHFGSATVDAYARWQRRLGYSGSAADGIPGKTSLTKLGAKYGFQVIA